MNKKTINLTEYDLKNIIKESVNNIIKESFNDKNISHAIKQHGGLKQDEQHRGASILSDYNLQDSIYFGYLSSDTINELKNCGLIFYISKYILYTNDGGAIAVSPLRNQQDPWNEKVKNRNQKWGENGPNKEDFESFWGYRHEDHDKPIEFNTVDRRLQRKEL